MALVQYNASCWDEHTIYSVDKVHQWKKKKVLGSRRAMSSIRAHPPMVFVNILSSYKLLKCQLSLQAQWPIWVTSSKKIRITTEENKPMCHSGQNIFYTICILGYATILVDIKVCSQPNNFPGYISVCLHHPHILKQSQWWGECWNWEDM